MFVLINLTSIGSIGAEAETTTSLKNIKKLMEQPYVIKQD